MYFFLTQLNLIRDPTFIHPDIAWFYKSDIFKGDGPIHFF